MLYDTERPRWSPIYTRYVDALWEGDQVGIRECAEALGLAQGLSEGDTNAFFPDFIAWRGKNVCCLDTKGGHLLGEAVTRKLFDIQDPDGQVKVHVRFISEGHQKALRGKAINGGYTVWKMKSGAPTGVHMPTLEKAVQECLK